MGSGTANKLMGAFPQKILCAGLIAYKPLKGSKAMSGQTVAITGAGGGLGSLAISHCLVPSDQVLLLVSKPQLEV